MIGDGSRGVEEGVDITRLKHAEFHEQRSVLRGGARGVECREEFRLQVPQRLGESDFGHRSVHHDHSHQGVLENIHSCPQPLFTLDTLRWCGQRFAPGGCGARGQVHDRLLGQRVRWAQRMIQQVARDPLRIATPCTPLLHRGGRSLRLVLDCLRRHLDAKTRHLRRVIAQSPRGFRRGAGGRRHPARLCPCSFAGVGGGLRREIVHRLQQCLAEGAGEFDHQRVEQRGQLRHAALTREGAGLLRAGGLQPDREGHLIRRAASHIDAAIEEIAPSPECRLAAHPDFARQPIESASFEHMELRMMHEPIRQQRGGFLFEQPARHAAER